MEKKSFIINELNSILENINLYCDKEKYKILLTVNRILYLLLIMASLKLIYI